MPGMELGDRDAMLCRNEFHGNPSPSAHRLVGKVWLSSSGNSIAVQCMGLYMGCIDDT